MLFNISHELWVLIFTDCLNSSFIEPKKVLFNNSFLAMKIPWNNIRIQFYLW